MTELNSIEVKALAIINPYIDSIQVYVDTNIVDGHAMTAAMIYEGFKNTCNCKLDADNFIRGFRIGVKSGRITGIEGVKRLGYRRVGDNVQTTTSTEEVVDVFEPYLNDVQIFVDKYIQDTVRMTAAVVYEKFKQNHKCELSEDDFVKSFRLAIKEGKINGLESAYRFGYKRIGTNLPINSDMKEEEEEKTGHDICEITIDDRRRLAVADRFNWVFQVRKDTGTWANEAYIPNIESGIRCLARRLLDDEMKGTSKFPLEDIANQVHQAEERIIDLLNKILCAKDQEEVPEPEVSPSETEVQTEG